MLMSVILTAGLMHSPIATVSCDQYSGNHVKTAPIECVMSSHSQPTIKLVGTSSVAKVTHNAAVASGSQNDYTPPPHNPIPSYGSGPGFGGSGSGGSGWNPGNPGGH